MSIFSQLQAAQVEQPTCNAFWICKQLGFSGSDAKCKSYIEGLIADHGFPAPLPHLKHGGGISKSVNYTRSQWLRIGVETWLGDYLPPEASAALNDEAAAAAAAEMDDAASHLVLVGGTEAA